MATPTSTPSYSARGASHRRRLVRRTTSVIVRAAIEQRIIIA